MAGNSYLNRRLFDFIVMSSARLQNIQNNLLPSVNLLAVSKGQSASCIRSLAELGQLDFGESRLQEALPKMSLLKDYKNIKWHFIGRLQSNKVRAVIKSFDFIHSVDSLVLGERISRIAHEEKKCPKIFLQIKLREDARKVGFSSEELQRAWPEIVQLKSIEVIGLMTIAPLKLALTDRKILFKECRELKDNLGLAHCSMGMSHDWKEAVEAGATWIRIGSLLFAEGFDDINCNRDITKSN